ncbi:hypothetical protein HYX13_05925 [Candidatus Woesearchaeota archaeon]|nr:hypothetical protein [Candidatus Woesearchaeota archaeon]
MKKIQQSTLSNNQLSNNHHNFKAILKGFWRFFWYDDSVASWLVNVIVAFAVIKFLVYPGLGLLLGTPFPIVAVVSESMEHAPENEILCGQQFTAFQESFDNYWKVCGEWYETRGIEKEEFQKFPFKNGFDKGDVIILWRANSNVHLGDILVFQGDKPQPIIHRVVKITEENSGKRYYQTKGDHNSESIDSGVGEMHITQERVYGKGVLRIPYLGWVKIGFVEVVKVFGIKIQR